MSKGDMPVSEIGLRDLAEVHVKKAVDRLGDLVESNDAQVAFEASRLIVYLARIRLPSAPWGPWTPEFDPGNEWGGIRAG